jgi:hypothetical protein
MIDEKLAWNDFIAMYEPCAPTEAEIFVMSAILQVNDPRQPQPFDRLQPMRLKRRHVDIKHIAECKSIEYYEDCDETHASSSKR